MSRNKIMMEQREITMYPSVRNRNDNPYLKILTGALNAAGIAVWPYRLLWPPRSIEVFHIHWLEAFMWSPLAKRSRHVQHLAAQRLLGFAANVRDRGGKVVWTAHNLKPHDNSEDIVMRFYEDFQPLVSDVISMTEAGQDELHAAYPRLAQVNNVIIPHPSYGQYFKQLGDIDVERRPLQAIVFGKIRRYKRVPEIVCCFRELDADHRLVIIGDGPDDECARVVDAIGGDKRIDFLRRRYRDDELKRLIRASEVAVFNFQSILNSGSILTALSLGCRVVAPSLGAVRELKEELGGTWVHTFGQDISSKALSNAFKAQRVDQLPVFGQSDPAVVAAKHSDLYFSNRPPVYGRSGRSQF